MSRRSHNKKTPTEFKIALLQRGITVTELADRLKKSRQAVSGVINGSDRFPHVLSMIEEVLHA